MTDSNQTINYNVFHLEETINEQQNIPIVDKDVALKQLLKDCDIIHDSSVIDIIIPSCTTTITNSIDHNIIESIKVDGDNKVYDLTKDSSSKNVLLGTVVTGPLSNNAVSTYDDKIVNIPYHPEELVDSEDFDFCNKQNFMNERCHPVAFIIGEYTPYPASVVDVQQIENGVVQIDINDEILHEVLEPVVSNNVLNQIDQKHRYHENSNDPNHKSPGAIRIRGINQSICHTSQSQSLFVNNDNLAPIEILEQVETNNNITYNNQNNDDENDSGPEYKDHVGIIRSTRNNNQNCQVFGDMAELVLGRKENVIVDDQNSTISSSISHGMIQPSVIINNIPEQRQLQNSDEDDHPVVAQAYTVSSLIVEAQPLRRNNQFIILILFVMMIAGILLGVLCQNGSCKSNSNNDNSMNNVPSSSSSSTSFRSINNDTNNENNNNNVIPSSAPTSQREPISDNNMLTSLIYQFVNGTFDNQKDKNDTTTIDRFGMIEYWDGTNTYDLSYLFSTIFNKEMVSFDADISHWDVQNAITMQGMFYGASSFNGNLSLWDVGRVQHFEQMFSEAKFFRGIGLEHWLLSPTVNDISYMFSGATLFDGNLSRWDVSNVKTMIETFSDTDTFRGIGLENWNTSQLTDAFSMFGRAWVFAGDLSNWDVSQVQVMSQMFEYAQLFDSNLSSWNVSNVLNMSYMFQGAQSFKGNGLSNWDVSKVEDMSNMFKFDYLFNADLSDWNVTLVSSMSSMFSGAITFNSDLSRWDVRSVVTMSYMFSGAALFDSDLSKWDVSEVRDLSGMFQRAYSFATSFRGIGLSEWNVRNVEFFDFTFAASSIIDVDLSKWDVRSAMSMRYMFANTPTFDSNVSGWNVESVKDFSYMFANASNFRGIGLENWVLSDDAVLDHMFCGADSFVPTHISTWNITSNVYCYL